MPRLTRLPFFLPAAALCLLIALLLSPVAALAAPQSDSEISGNDPVAEVTGEFADAGLDGGAVPAAAESQSWMEQVDATFGEYLVGPVAAVLFYDFGTGERFKQSIPFVVVWLLAGGIFLTLRMGFINIRGFRHAIQLTRGDYDTPDEPGEVTHFQALSAALSATVGLGNIAGVAIAIATGGPGATFWIIMVGLFGMSAKFAECTLGQLYRTTDADGNVIGGPMRYLRYGMKDLGWGPAGTGLGVVLSTLFMVLCIGASFGGGNAFQVGQSLEAIRGDVPILQTAPWAYGVLMAVAVGVVIIGGIKSIGAVAGKIVPFMCLAYVSAALYILVRSYAEIPAAASLIVSQAFTPDAAYGGFLGVLVIGIKRAVFSNEAGVGSAAIAHSAAKTDEPVSEGIVALLEPFIDTVVVCTITALLIVVTGSYLAPETDIDSVKFNVGTATLTDASSAQIGELAKLLDENSHTNLVVTTDDPLRTATINDLCIQSDIASNRIIFAAPEPLAEGQVAPADQVDVKIDVAKSEGARLTLHAFTQGGHDWFRYVLYLAVVLFAYSTCISWFYYGERCWVQLFGVKSSIVFKAIFLMFTVLGSIVTRGNILDFSDLMILGMSFPNLLGVFLMSGLVRRKLDEYWKRYQSDDLAKASDSNP